MPKYKVTVQTEYDLVIDVENAYAADVTARHQVRQHLAPGVPWRLLSVIQIDPPLDPEARCQACLAKSEPAPIGARGEAFLPVPA